MQILTSPDRNLIYKKRIPGPDGILPETKQEALQKLLLMHPFPRYQGPFKNNIIDNLQYDHFTSQYEEESDCFFFNSYTTFVHKDSQPCKLWSINNQLDNDEPKLSLTFTTKEIPSVLNLCGPASDLNRNIIYNCNHHKCVIMCPYKICEICEQCLEHHVDLQRKFNSKLDSFTIPCSSNQFIPWDETTLDYVDNEFDEGHKYAGIPRSCKQCRLDLLDHQIHHHVLHHHCKFCSVIKRIWDKVDSKIGIIAAKIQIKRTDNSTCSFC